jgi:hypothetical protein
MKIQRYLAALLVVPALASIQSCSASKLDPNQKATLKAKPAVVRVVSICEGGYRWYPLGKAKSSFSTYIPIDASFIGTGFLIDPSGYIVTSSDVIQNKEDCIKRLKENIVQKIQKDYPDDLDYKKPEVGDIQVDRKSDNFGKFYPAPFQSGKVILPNVSNEPLTFQVEATRRNSGEPSKLGNNVAIIRIQVTKAPIVKLSKEDSIQIQDFIITIGYPLTTDTDTSGKSLVESTVDDGKITNADKQVEGGYPILQTNIRGGEGILGSPLLNNQGEAIGMIASVKGGVTLAIPQKPEIQALIKGSGATFNEGGLTEKYYLDGLNDFEKGNLVAARAKFSNVKNLFPAHSEVDKLILKIDNILASRYNKPWKDPTYQRLFALIVGGGVVAALAYFLLRRKSSGSKAPAGSPGLSAQGGSVLKPPYQGNGAGTQSWVELEYQGQTRKLPLYKDEHRLGRDPQWSDVAIPTSWEVISRHHAILRKEGEDYRIYDGDGKVPSSNGLWIDDDIRVNPQDGYPLRNGDQLKIGKDSHEQIVLTYFNPSSSQAAQPRETKMA